jgi:hypothetical protein
MTTPNGTGGAVPPLDELGLALGLALGLVLGLALGLALRDGLALGLAPPGTTVTSVEVGEPPVALVAVTK